jgi:hypothetical protein
MSLSQGRDCLSFDGDDYVEAPNLITGYPFTFEAWSNFNTNGVGSGLVFISDSSVSNKFYGIQYNGTNDKFRLVYQNTTFVALESTTIPIAGTWYHVAGVFESSTSRKLYINGILESSSSGSVSFNNNVNNEVLIGLLRKVSPTGYANGLIDDVRVWNTARTGVDILANMNKRLIGNETGLVGYWNLDEGSGSIAYDSTSNANNGTITGATYDYTFNTLRLTEDGILKVKDISDAPDCLNFDGTNQVQVNNPVITDYPFTLECWAKVDAIGSIQSFMSLNNSSSQYFELGIGVGGAIRVVARNTTAFANAGGSAIAINTWYHVAAVFISDSDRKLYVNGVEQSLGAITGVTFFTPARLLFGLTRTSSPIYYLTGGIDDARLWNTARTEAEIQANMNQELIGNETGLVGYWKLDEGNGLTAYDSTSNANNGTITGATWDYTYDTFRLTQQGKLKVKGIVQGKDCLSFDGGTNRINCGNSSVFNIASAICMEGWVYFKESATKELFAKMNNANTGTSGSYELFQSGQKITFRTGSNTMASLSDIPLNTWTHIVADWDGTTKRILINGVIDQSTAYSTAITSTTGDFVIGGYPNGNYPFIGLMDDVRLWNISRLSQIPANMNIRLRGDESGLVGCWNFDDGVGTTATDSTSNGNDGTITGATWDYTYDGLFRLSEDGILKLKEGV